MWGLLADAGWVDLWVPQATAVWRPAAALGAGTAALLTLSGSRRWRWQPHKWGLRGSAARAVARVQQCVAAVVTMAAGYQLERSIARPSNMLRSQGSSTLWLSQLFLGPAFLHNCHPPLEAPAKRVVGRRCICQHQALGSSCAECCDKLRLASAHPLGCRAVHCCVAASCIISIRSGSSSIGSRRTSSRRIGSGRREWPALAAEQHQCSGTSDDAAADGAHLRI